MRGVNRRVLLKLASASAALASLPWRPAHAALQRRHGLSIFGDLALPEGFAHLPYVNPEAPRGGTFSQIGPEVAYNASFLSFDTLNGYILKGDAAQGLELIFDSLMVRNYDEPDAMYGLVAEWVELSEDGNRAVFGLREAARFHDGTPLTAEDAAYSLALLKADGHPLIAQNLIEMESATADGPHRLILTFSGRQTRDLPQFIAQLPIFSKAYYETHAFDETTLEPPLGSGPYGIGDFKAGTFINYDRADDYWAQGLNVNVGMWNFDRIRFEFYRERTIGFEAFKSGAYLCREEFTSKTWATEYNFPAVEDGRVERLTLPDHRPSGAQGWFINTRRAQFSDPKVREALTYAYDFEWANRNLFYDTYTRTQSFLENSPMKAEGLPSEAELALLDPYREQLPEAVFGPAILPPVSNGTGKDRKNLRAAARLLDEAGWTIVDGKRRNEAGETLTIELLNDAPSFSRVFAPYVANLKFLGIDANERMVDSAQFQRRLKSFDFDLVVQRYGVQPVPGVEIRAYWASQFANLDGSRNLSGIDDPVIDLLIDKVITAETREAQLTAARALDRVLRAGWYWVPQWYKASHHLAFWDVFDRPERTPRYKRGVMRTWWVDEAKAKAVGIEG